MNLANWLEWLCYLLISVLCSLNQLKPVLTHCLRCYEFGSRILGRNWDKSLKSFPPCYSQSPLLKHFTPLSPWVKVGWNWFIMYSKHCIQKPLVWEFSRLCLETSTKLYVHEFGFGVDRRTRISHDAKLGQGVYHGGNRRPMRSRLCLITKQESAEK